MTQRESLGIGGKFWIGFLLLLGFACTLFAQQTSLPSRPGTYFTDQAHVVDPSTAASINRQLEQFERDTSSQILVAVYPALPADAELAQYCIDTYNAWGVGQKGKDNGAVLFIFANSHQMFICTGRGLEGALPDALCKNIISQIITPAFRQGHYAAGIQAGVSAMLSAARNEYKGTGETNTERNQQGVDENGIPFWVILLFILIFIVCRSFIIPGLGSGPFIYTGGGFGGGGGGFGGGGGGFGGGGFTGGGGSSAGGGAGGSW